MKCSIAAAAALLALLPREASALFVDHEHKEMTLHIAFIGDTATAQHWTKTVWEKTRPEQRSSIMDIHHGELTRRSFSFAPSLPQVRGLTVRFAVDAVWGEGVDDGDLNDLLRAADVVVVASPRPHVEALLARLRRNLPVVDGSIGAGDPFPSLKEAARLALLSCVDKSRPAALDAAKDPSYAPGQTEALRAYLSATFVRNAVTKILRGQRQDFDMSGNPGEPSTAQVMSFAGERGTYSLVTSGLSAHAVDGNCRFELVQRVSGPLTAALDRLVAIKDQLVTARVSPCIEGALRVHGSDYRLSRSPLNAQITADDVPVQRLMHSGAAVDGYFLRGSPVVLGWSLAAVPAVITQPVTFIEVTPAP
jgi:hypothetical protein